MCIRDRDIEDLGTVTLSRGGHVIHCLTVIGQIEGHTEAPQGQKTTGCTVMVAVGTMWRPALRWQS